jgi:tyrosine aminotransferase
MSDHCQRVFNPIRSFVENEIAFIPATELSDPSRPKDPINVSYGDPCVYKDFKPNPNDLELLVGGVGKYDGYCDFPGIPETRKFLKDFYTARGNFEVDESDVFLTQGCSMALWLAINTLAEKGDNILVPNPGFPLSKAIAKSQHIGVKEYLLLPHQNWEIDLKDLEGHIDEHTKAILINNPSNPTGAVFSRHHIVDICKIADKYKLPIIADEVYEDMVYPGLKFVSFAEVSTNVPILLCSGLSKKQFAPGWRTGWLVLNGAKGVFDQIKIGLNNLLSILMNSNTICMQNIPQIVDKDPNFLKGKMEKIEHRMEVLKENLTGVDCYEVLKSQGAMYAVILVNVEKFQDITDTKDFCVKLYKSHNVLCFPGECFGGKNFVRIVTCSDEVVIKELCKRMKEFYLINQKK